MQLFSLMPFLPLAGFIILALFGRRLREPLPGIIGAGTVGLAFLVAIAGFVSMHGAAGPARQVLWDFLPYLGGNGKNLPIAFRLDQLSAVMALVVTGVGFLIHVYSIGYMAGNKGYSRFFAYMNFFVALMLVLVLADSYPVMFIGWEGVGVASYLLIGFEYEDFRNTDAGRKAFIVNRIGDLFFILGMALAFHAFGSLNIQDVAAGARATAYGAPVVELVGLFFLLAAAGKSAQLPLSTWLPDAMAGPTPVSALIHAATMVTAGVYLIARSGALFTQAPAASGWVAWVGALTALFGAVSAIAQTDIKKILAYSTISQLGFMFIAVGSGAYWVGIFHVITHA
ncbi:MAG TPA: NADH-quinone oxidoreductase subunit L, partial [Deinococcales bacterium]|nr:NADH-quinone oxidoreductase subunit L [Deinococcales bacterium]